MMKEKSGRYVSLTEFEMLKADLAENKEKAGSLSLQLEEMKKQKEEEEVLKNGLEKENAELKKEKTRLFEGNQDLAEKISTLSSASELDKSTIKLMDEEISQLKANVLEAETFTFEQHKLGFEKVLQQAKHFYNIPIDEGNFDVKKDFYKGELIPVNEIPNNEADDIDVEN